MSAYAPFTTPDAAAWIAEPSASDDKYSRGVLGVATGSDRYPGAAVLGVEAALRTGVGMVRYVGPSRATDLVLARRPEAVPGRGRVQAWLIGSGMDAADRDDALLTALASELYAEDRLSAACVVADEARFRAALAPVSETLVAA